MKTTDELQQELMESPNLKQFLCNNQDAFEPDGCGRYLEELIDRKGISKSRLASSADMSTVYLYQILSGTRNPSRDRLLTLCVAMEATIDETQLLLKQCGMAILYSKHRRDAIIMMGIVRKMSLFEVNDALYSENEKTLS